MRRRPGLQRIRLSPCRPTFVSWRSALTKQKADQRGSGKGKPFPEPLSGALSNDPPAVYRLAAGGEVLYRRADALEEGEGLLGEKRAFRTRAPRVLPLLRVAGEVVELGLIVGSAQDQGPLSGGNGDRHVVGDPTRFGVYGGDDLTLGEIQRPGAHDEGPVLFPAPFEDAPEGVAGHGRRHTAEAHEVHYRRGQVGGGRHRLGAAWLQARAA